MRKGLTTLLTVAIALIGSNAMAMAPTISDIPSPIIGGRNATQTTKFVYVDAFDLNLLVSDDQTTPTSLLKWSYDEVGSTYTINGTSPIFGADANTVATVLQINNNVGTFGSGNATVETNTDGKKNTITIRNQKLYPLGGTASTAAATGFADILPITFWCSDGNAASSQTILFYTDHDAANRLSAKVKNWTVLNKESFVGKSWAVSETFFGTITTHTWPADGKGICFEVAKTGNNWGSVASPMPFFSLTANTLYRVRAKMNCSQVAPGHTPFWDFIIENSYDAVTRKGLNLYSMDQIFLDNVGGANSVVSSQTGTELLMYFAPSPVSCTNWNNTAVGTGLYSTTYANGKDCRLRFRVLDVDSNTALLNDQKYGAICLQSVQVESIPMNKVVADATPLTSITYFKRNTDTANPTLNNTSASGFVGPSIVFAGATLKYLTITPAGGGTSSELITVQPANDNLSTTMADDWPIPWVSNKIYELDVQMSAPDSNSQLHPYDAMWLGIYAPTNEINCETVVTSYKLIGSPRTGTPQTYKMFFNTQNETVVNNAAYHFLQWRVRFGNNTSLNMPNASDTTNNGGVRLHGLSVWNVTVPTM